jgi:hypothetical protein
MIRKSMPVFEERSWKAWEAGRLGSREGEKMRG